MWNSERKVAPRRAFERGGVVTRRAGGIVFFPFLLALCLLTPGILEAVQPGGGTVVRVFAMKYRKADEAAVVVRPLLTDDGSLLIHPRQNTLTVRDAASVVEKAAQALASFDVAPRARMISVTLLKAGPDPGKGRPVRDDLKAVGDRLRKLFNFPGYSTLDSAIVQCVEGESVAYPIAGDYRIEFFLEPSGEPDLVRLKNLSLSRTKRQNGQETRQEILKTSINIPLDQPYVLGIGRDEAAPAALFLVFQAAPFGPGPGYGVMR